MWFYETRRPWRNKPRKKPRKKGKSTLVLSDMLLLGLVALHYYMATPLTDQKHIVAMDKIEV